MLFRSVRDSGLVHALLGLSDLDAVLGHPIAGSSWEGFVLEQLINAAPQAQASFYRTSNGAEVDLVLTFRQQQTWAPRANGWSHRWRKPIPSKRASKWWM